MRRYVNPERKAFVILSSICVHMACVVVCELVSGMCAHVRECAKIYKRMTKYYMYHTILYVL